MMGKFRIMNNLDNIVGPHFAAARSSSSWALRVDLMERTFFICEKVNQIALLASFQFPPARRRARQVKQIVFHSIVCVFAAQS
jgi:hypothetical protein